MKEDLVSSFVLAVGLRISNNVELGLAPHDAKVVHDFGTVKFAPVVENHYTKDAEAGDDILPDKLLNFGGGGGGDSFDFYALGKVINRDKKVLVLTRGFGERSKYIYTPSSKW